MKIHVIIILCLALAFFCCKKKPVDVLPETRSFYMGTTPWPADFTSAELDTAYNFINNYCDIVSHHFDDGIPYEEAFNNSAMPAKFLTEISTRKTKTPAAKKIFLSIAALNLTRKEKAGYYSGATIADSIKNRWAAYAFDDNRVITAYVNYVSYLINQFQPIYVNYGVESNVLNWNTADFNKYKFFLAQVYAQLKAKYPAIPFFISFIVDESSEGYNFARSLLPYTDWIGLSSYAYVTVSSSGNGNTDPKLFPANYYERFINLDLNKPLAFAETGYIAENLNIPSFNLNKTGNAVWQRDYIDILFKLSNNNRAKLFIWFCSKDYNAGSNTLRGLGLYTDLFGLWEDTGLKDENGNKRPAFFVWEEWMKKSRVNN